MDSLDLNLKSDDNRLEILPERDANAMTTEDELDRWLNEGGALTPDD